MEIFFTIIAIASLVFCVFVVVDKVIFDRVIKDIPTGSTGKDIQARTNHKLRIVKIEKESYQAIITSRLTLFKYRLIFFKGKLISKQKE